MTEQKQHGFSRVLRKFGWGILLSVFTVNAYADVYAITDLGANFQPLSINESGLITGIDTSNSTTTAVLYRDSTLVPLLSQSYAKDINESGLVVGYEINSPNNRALLWDNGQLTTELEQFSNLLQANSISTFNEIVGIRLVDNLYQRAFSYDMYSGNLATLATLGGANAWANSINDRGQITGASEDAEGNKLAFRYDSFNAAITNIGTFNGYQHTEGLAINEQNSVVGMAYNRTDPHSGKRAIWAIENGGLVNLGTLNHDIDSIARDINNDGFVVGQSVRVNGEERAFLYDTSENDVLHIVADPVVPTTIYTGSTKDAGIAKTTNRGQDWFTSNLGLVNGTINGITIDPVNNSRIYAATNGGVFISNNGGNSWTLLSETLNDFPTYDVHFDASDSTRSLMYVGTDQGIFYSRDGGASWTLAENTSTFGSFQFVSFPTVNFNYVFAATSNGVYRSTDEGVSWDQSNGQDETRLFTRFVTTMALNSEEPDVLYVGTRGGGVYRGTQITSDIQWTAINSGIENRNINTILVDNTTTPSTLYTATNDALYTKSTDVNEEWTKIRDNGVFSIALAYESIRKSLYATTFDGSIFRSDDDTTTLGTSWISVTPGIAASDVYTLTVIPNSNANESKIYAGTSDGIYATASNTAVDQTIWSSVNSGASGFKITAIAYDDRSNPPKIWAGSSDQGIYISEDNGQNWLSANTGLDNYNISDIEVDTTTLPPILYAATLGGVYRSIDGGVNWSALNNGLASLSIYSLLLDTSVTPKILYAGTADGVFRSSDQGRNWVPINIGLGNTDIVDLVMNPTDNKMIFAASASTGLWRSTDQGQTWENLNSGSGGTSLGNINIFDIDHDSTTPGTFIVASKAGVYKISDAFCATPAPCWSWQAINGDPNTLSLANATVYAIAYNPDDANQLFAGTDTDGVYKSVDSGATWELMSQGLESRVNQMVSLNSQITDSNWDLRDATSIDNLGHIVGWGYLNGEPHGYLLTPDQYNQPPGVPKADLTVHMISTPDTLKPNVPMSFEITITNNGPDAATDVQLSDWIPPNILYRHSSTSQGICNKSEIDPPVIRCRIGTIDIGDSVNISIFMEPQEPEINIRNIASAKAFRSEGNLNQVAEDVKLYPGMQGTCCPVTSCPVTCKFGCNSS